MEDTNTSQVAEIRDPAAVLKALEQANKEAKSYRENIQSLTAQLEESRNRVKELEEGGNPYKELAIKANVRLALAESNVRDSERIMRFLDLGGIEIDESGKLVGLDEKLTSLKTDIPELFDVKRKVANKADAFAGGDAKVEKSITEQQVDLMFGR